jgi:hypothetical protein
LRLTKDNFFLFIEGLDENCEEYVNRLRKLRWKAITVRAEERRDILDGSDIDSLLDIDTDINTITTMTAEIMPNITQAFRLHIFEIIYYLCGDKWFDLCNLSDSEALREGFNVNYKSLTIGLRINNLLNSLYEANGYNYSYQYGGELITENFYYPQAGNNYMAVFNLKF